MQSPKSFFGRVFCAQLAEVEASLVFYVTCACEQHAGTVSSVLVQDRKNQTGHKCKKAHS